MKDEEIRRYAEIMKTWGLEHLSVTENGTTISLGRPCQTDIPAAVGDHEPKPREMTGSSDYSSVLSPMVGVFYAAPAENADPFVSVGDQVKEGDTLCIIEAMKLMNEIRAEYSGVISKICVTNGQVVEYGTELFQIER